MALRADLHDAAHLTCALVGIGGLLVAAGVQILAAPLLAPGILAVDLAVRGVKRCLRPR